VTEADLVPYNGEFGSPKAAAEEMAMADRVITF
jgi:hypothetical protein